MKELKQHGYCVDIDCPSCGKPSGVYEPERTYKELMYKELKDDKIMETAREVKDGIGETNPELQREE